MADITNIVFDQVNGPQLWLLNADGSNSSSLYIDGNNRLVVSSSTNTQISVESASYALTASYAMNGGGSVANGTVSSSAQLSNGGGTAFTNTNNVTFGAVTGSKLLVGKTSPSNANVDINSNTTITGSLNVTGSINGTYLKGLINIYGYTNTALGLNALKNVTMAGYDGSWNVAVGTNALSSLTTGNYNIAIGDSALSSATTDGYNIAIGYSALSAYSSSTVYGNNTAIGFAAMQYTTKGNYNTAVGQEALRNNSVGSNNVALGQGSLTSNQSSRNDSNQVNSRTGLNQQLLAHLAALSIQDE